MFPEGKKAFKKDLKLYEELGDEDVRFMEMETVKGVSWEAERTLFAPTNMRRSFMFIDKNYEKKVREWGLLSTQN